MKKEETLEEAAEKVSSSMDYREFDIASFKLGAKWQAERMYTEEEVHNILIEYTKTNPVKPYRPMKWFAQYKRNKS